MQDALHDGDECGAEGAGIGDVEMDAVDRIGPCDGRGVEEMAIGFARELAIMMGEKLRFGDGVVEIADEILILSLHQMRRRHDQDRRRAATRLVDIGARDLN